MKEKITTGANDRPKNEMIATGEGVPDDSGNVIEVDKAGVAKIRGQLFAESEDDRPDEENRSRRRGHQPTYRTR